MQCRKKRLSVKPRLDHWQTILVAVTSECSVKRVIRVKPALGHSQTVQTQIRRQRMRPLITVCTVCLNYRKLKVKWNSLKSPFRTIFPAYTQRQSTNNAASALILMNHKGWRLGLTLVLLNKLRCHTHFLFSANHITWSRLWIQIHMLKDKQCRSRSVGFFRSQLIWIYTVYKDRVYLDSAGQGLRFQFQSL